MCWELTLRVLARRATDVRRASGLPGLIGLGLQQVPVALQRVDRSDERLDEGVVRRVERRETRSLEG